MTKTSVHSDKNVPLQSGGRGWFDINLGQISQYEQYRHPRKLELYEQQFYYTSFPITDATSSLPSPSPSSPRRLKRAAVLGLSSNVAAVAATAPPPLTPPSSASAAASTASTQVTSLLLSLLPFFPRRFLGVLYSLHLLCYSVYSIC
jgi:hypothetical protein